MNQRDLKYMRDTLRNHIRFHPRGLHLTPEQIEALADQLLKRAIEMTADIIVEGH
jgi:hypothetical protein